MKLNLQGINLQKTHGTFHSEHGEIMVQLSDVIELKGALSRTGQETQLQGIEAKGLRLALGLPLSKGRFSLSSPATLLGVKADLTLPFAGSIAAESLHATKAILSLSSTRVDFDIQAHGISFLRTKEKTTIEVKALTLHHVRVSLEGMEVHLGTIEAKELSVSFGEEPLQIRLGSARLNETAIQNPQLHLNANLVELIGGFSLVGSDITVGRLDADKLSLTMQLGKDAAPPESSGGTSPGQPPQPPPTPPTPSSAKAFSLDLKLLDGVFGHANVDAVLHAKVPVIGQRRATHRFRIPIEEGMLNYKKLEKNLSGLEDAFIDIEINKGRLAIQRDIPLIPDIPKPIVLWDLDAKELELAKKQLVRLRTLPRAYLAPSDEKKDKDKPSSVALEYLALQGIDVSLSLKAPAQPVDGAIETASIQSLRVNGSLQYKPTEVTAPTALEVLASEIDLSLKELPIGARALSIERVLIQEVEKSSVTFFGVKPKELRLSLTGAQLSGVALR